MNVHIRDEHVTEELIMSADAVAKVDNADNREILEKLTARSKQVLFHEHYHFWQGLRLPFLYRYALLAQRGIFLAFRDLSLNSPNFKTWSCVIPDFSRLDLDGRIGFVQSKVFYSPTGAEFEKDLKIERVWSFTPLDLLECAATLAEFQYSSASTSNDETANFRRWSNRNPSETGALDALTHFLENKGIALRACLPLINACFSTTDPIRAFCLLAHHLRSFLDTENGYQFIEQREPCRWPELFAQILSKITFEAPADSSTDLLETRFMLLTLEYWVNAEFESGLGHPVLTIPARDWVKQQKQNTELSLVMDQPWLLDLDSINRLMDSFGPPITVMKIYHVETSRTLVYGNRRFKEVQGLSHFTEFSFKGFFADISTIYSLVRRASEAHYNPDHRTCGHRLCPEYGDNFCNSYLIVPDDYSKCGFVTRAARLVEGIRNGRDIN
jgi:hypothetical protein